MAMRRSDLSWAAYVAGHPERLPRDRRGETWADVSPAEYRRVTRNWRRWQRRRLTVRVALPALPPVPVEQLSDWPEAEAVRFTIRGVWDDA